MEQILSHALDFFPVHDHHSRNDVFSVLRTSRAIHDITLRHVSFHRIAIKSWKAHSLQRCQHDPATIEYLIFLVKNAHQPLELYIDLQPWDDDDVRQGDDDMDVEDEDRDESSSGGVLPENNTAEQNPTTSSNDDTPPLCPCIDILLQRPWAKLFLSTGYGFDNLYDFVADDIPHAFIRNLTRLETTVCNGDGGGYFPSFLTLLAQRQAQCQLSTATWGWEPQYHSVTLAPPLPSITTLTLYASTRCCLPTLARMPNLHTLELIISFSDWSIRPEWRWVRGTITLPHLHHLIIHLTYTPQHHLQDLLENMALPSLQTLTIEWGNMLKPTTVQFFCQGLQSLLRQSRPTLSTFTFLNNNVPDAYGADEFIAMLLSVDFPLERYHYQWCGFLPGSWGSSDNDSAWGSNSGWGEFVEVSDEEIQNPGSTE
ncbi:hypothetical protein VNI00_006457 [Paramarasmius palmivorus]|uniref:F-box domain-containing protein n=1 Tax=Paramarasmius palmivorus TaxID=297713 RepID=A0AAW0DB96_9AGAR